MFLLQLPETQSDILIYQSEPGYIEAWGRGIEKINQECDLAGVPKPDYNYEFAGLMITFKTDIGEKTPGKSSPKTELKVIELIMDKPEISTATIGENLVSPSVLFVNTPKDFREKGCSNELVRPGAGKLGNYKEGK